MFQREASLRVTRGHVKQILRQERTLSSFDQLGITVKNHKQELLTSKTLRNIQDKIDVDSTLPNDTLKFVIQARDKGASSWLHAVPVGRQGLALNKMEFRDALRLRYNLRLENLPSECVCGEKFGVYHALSWKRGGFISQRHDEIRNLFASLLNKVLEGVQRLELLQFAGG